MSIVSATSALTAVAPTPAAPLSLASLRATLADADATAAANSLASTTSNISGLAQQLLDEDIVASLASESIGAGVYNSTGVLQSLPGALTDYWADALKTNPALANTFTSAFFTQGVVGTLDLYA